MTIKQEVEKVFRDRGFEPREHSVRNIIGEFHLPTKPHVTAIGTSGGKTFTTAGRLEFLYKYGYIKPNQSVLIMAADKTILRGNFVEQFTTFFKDVPASFTWRGIANRKELKQAVQDGVNVIITLPQTINDSKKLELLKTNNITWFIQDEAHKWYFKKTIQRIIKTLKPKYQSLLTGTPFKFNAKKDDFIFDYTSVAEMYGKGYLSDFTAQVLHSSVELTKIDYVSLLGNLKEAKRFTENEVQESFNDVVNDIIKKLKLPLKSLTTTHNVTNNISSVFGKLEKTIIFTHGTAEANYLYKYLQTQKVGSLVSHSNLKVDDAESTFQEFKDNDDIKILVAVNRGKEGFDFTQLYNVIDMTYSQNFEVVMQMIGRILRKSDKIKNKYFFKVAPKNTAGYFKDWMNAMFMLFDNEWYSKYNGKNGFDIRVPNQLLSSNKPSNSTTTNKSKSTKGKLKPQNLEFFNSLSFMQDNKWFKLDDKVSTVASTTLKEIFIKHKNYNSYSGFTREFLSYDEAKKYVQKLGIKSYTEYVKWCKLGERPFNIPSNPDKIYSEYNAYDFFNKTKAMLHNKLDSYMSFDEAKQFIKKFNLKNQKEFNEWTKSDKRPWNFPSSPKKIYSNEYVSLSDFLGYSKPERWEILGYLSFKEASNFIKKYNLPSLRSYQRFRNENKHLNLAYNPDRIYKNCGFTTWKDFLGYTENPLKSRKTKASYK